MASEPRCTLRKHVIENNVVRCDCGAIYIGPTAARNAQVVTILDREKVTGRG